MPDVLLYGDSERSPALRHEIPVAVGDPFLYAEVGGTAYVLTHDLERARISAARPDAEIIDVMELGFHELIGTGISRVDVELELASRAVKRTGLREALVDFDFPIGIAERLRSDGVTLVVDDQTVIPARRRAKSEPELAGIRRAQAAAEASIAAAAGLLRRAEPVGDTLHVDGEPLLAERVRETMRHACSEHGALLPATAIVASVWQGYGHEPGSGPLPAGLPIEIDVWPRDEETSCWADMTRTFLIGGAPDEEVRRQEQLVRDALERARESVKPGVLGRDLYNETCDRFEAAGYRTMRTGPGDDPAEGFQFSLGHGVGLEVHEQPGLGRTGREPLVPGDVLAVEPGLWRRDVGGVRFEDLLLVTDDGCETLTSYSYSLTP